MYRKKFRQAICNRKRIERLNRKDLGNSEVFLFFLITRPTGLTFVFFLPDLLLLELVAKKRGRESSGLIERIKTWRRTLPRTSKSSTYRSPFWSVQIFTVSGISTFGKYQESHFWFVTIYNDRKQWILCHLMNTRLENWTHSKLKHWSSLKRGSEFFA